MAFSDNHAFDSELNNPSVALLGGSTGQSYQSLGLRSLPAQGEALLSELDAPTDNLSGKVDHVKQESAAFIEKLLGDSASVFESSSGLELLNEATDTEPQFEAISTALQAPALLENTLLPQQLVEGSTLSTDQSLQLPGTGEFDSTGAETLAQQSPVTLALDNVPEPVEFLGTVFGGEPQPIGSLPLSQVRPLLASIEEDALGLLA